MNEHDDDLEPEVDEDADEERYDFPDTDDDELTEPVGGSSGEGDDDVPLDEDPAEL
jgi:hypothetical protein